MSKRGHYPGGHTVVRGRAPSSKDRKVKVGVLDNLAAYNASTGPAPKPQKAPKKPKPQS